ncbi:MAG: SDR family NAD(P)-dependent oxidoreductase [Gammaproteobacteria bacterium]
MSRVLDGRVAVITGASRGIGAAIARRFAAEGAKVVITARTLAPGSALPGSLEEVAAALRDAGGECQCVAADLADPDSRARILPAAIERYGGVDILVNNAAWARFQPSHQMAMRHARLAFEVNVFAPLQLAQQAVPSMMARGGGWILNLSSGTALSPDPAPYAHDSRYFQFHQSASPSVYGSTKAALQRLTAGMAAELAGHRIAVNTLAPVEAVASEGALHSGTLDATTHYEPVEAMAEAALQLCSADPAALSGRFAVSLPLLRELGVPVRSLDGTHLIP